jgi:hypothetical protein
VKNVMMELVGVPVVAALEIVDIIQVIVSITPVIVIRIPDTVDAQVVHLQDVVDAADQIKLYFPWS